MSQTDKIVPAYGLNVETSPGGLLRWAEQANIRRESIFVLLYYLGYLAYLMIFIDFENEITHWLTLVLLPFSLLFLIQKQTMLNHSLEQTISSIGLTKKQWKKGLIWAFLLGLSFLPLQLFFSRERESILALLCSGRFFLHFPLVFALMLLTAGFTEEFFFRGVMQTRLTRISHSNLWGILLTSLLFAIYHLPYAYFLEQWPSYGNFQEALVAVLVEGGPVGIILGTLYARSKNLLAPILLHSTFNAIVGVVFLNVG